MIKTLNYTEYLPIQTVVDLKKIKGSSVSVVIPAKNEEQTIGSIVNVLKSLSGSGRLIDEIIVMDSSSEDTTKAIARNAGATVVEVSDIKPEIAAIGKGVALWKSQFVATGDILIFIDADILDFDMRFIVGLAGALLTCEKLEIVKAAYRRPFILGNERHEDGGGRVTELLVRPLINMFLPELSELRQPLAGEYAFRRETLQQLPFYSAYGVDIGLLLEQYARTGKDSIGQVEMGCRTHRNRSLLDLSKMAFEIEDAFFSFLDTYRTQSCIHKRNSSMKIWENGQWAEHELRRVLLPPKVAYERK